MRSVLDDWRTAPVHVPLRAMLAFLEKLTLTPETVNAEDVLALRAVGLDDAAIEDAIAVCTLFNLIDRVADALNVGIPSEEGFAETGRALLHYGYVRNSPPP